MSSGALFVVPLEITSPGALTSTDVDTSADPAAYDVGHTYAAGDQSTSSDAVYQSLAAGNIGNAVSDVTKWVRVGAINKFRMFDRKVGSQTEKADSIEVVITPVSVVDVVSVRNVEALTVTVVQETAEEGIVYSKTVELDDPVGDWYEYFFAPITRQTEALFNGLSPFTDATYTITVDNPGGTAKCGELLMGAALDAGMTEAGVSVGIDDYSLIAADEFGVRDIVERDFADNMDLTVYVQRGKSPTLRRLLTHNRATPILVIASDARSDAQVYGLAESWRCVLSYPDMDVYNITMKGLT